MGNKRTTYTEAEAAEKACQDAAREDGCIGHECMAWRWLGAAPDPTEPDDEGRLGYCGLAGKPNLG